MGLFDSFMGTSQRKDIQRGSEQAEENYRQGLDDYVGTQKNYLDRSLEFLEPGVGAGRDATSILRAALGLDGPEAQQQFYSSFQTDPGFQTSTQAGIDQLDNSAASRGMLLSGGQVRDVADYGARRMQGAFDTRLNQLFRLGETGGAQAGAAAGLTSQTGSQIADARFGTSQLLANNNINTGNAVAETRGIPINNLLSILNSGAKVAASAVGAPG